MRPRRIEREEHHDHDDVVVRDEVVHDDLTHETHETVERDIVDETGVRRTVRREPQDVHDVEEHRGYRETRMAAWSPAQIGAFIMGIFFVALGAVALARGGFSDFLAGTTVMGLGHTPLLGLIEIVWGIFMIAAGAIPGAQRGVMAFLGATALAGGLIIVIEPTAFRPALGADAANGWLYLVVGVVTLVITFVAPVIRARDSVYQDQRW